MQDIQFPEQQPKKGFGIAAFVLGLISLLCCCVYPLALVLSVLAIVFAIVQYKQGGFTGLTIAGLVLAVIGLAIGVFLLVSSLTADPVQEQKEMEEFMKWYEEYLQELFPVDSAFKMLR